MFALEHAQSFGIFMLHDDQTRDCFYSFQILSKITHSYLFSFKYALPPPQLIYVLPPPPVNVYLFGMGSIYLSLKDLSPMHFKIFLWPPFCILNDDPFFLQFKIHYPPPLHCVMLKRDKFVFWRSSSSLNHHLHPLVSLDKVFVSVPQKLCCVSVPCCPKLYKLVFSFPGLYTYCR